MSCQCYLHTGQELLFEASRRIPAFWLLGLEERELRRLRKDTFLLQKLLVDDHEDSARYNQYACYFLKKYSTAGVIRVNIKDYLAAVKGHRKYIKQVYPQLEGLYSAFIQKVSFMSLEEEDILIKYCELLEGYEDYTDFYGEIKAFTEAVASQLPSPLIKKDDYVVSALGFDGFIENEFVGLSPRI